jgi:hypothetical protein
MPGKSLTVIDSTDSINKAVMCTRSNDVDYISEEAVNSLDGHIKSYQIIKGSGIAQLV